MNVANDEIVITTSIYFTNPQSTALETSTLTITPPMWLLDIGKLFAMFGVHVCVTQLTAGG
jgi:hypothetical protein